MASTSDTELAWAIVLAAGGLLELAGARSTKDRWPTLTDLIRRYVPKTLIAAALAWLAWHFGVTG